MAAISGAVDVPVQNPLIVGNKVLSTQSIQCINYEEIKPFVEDFIK